MSDPLAPLYAEPDRTRRGLRLVALLSEAIGREAVVVGGFAVETWTRGGYATADIDLVCSDREAAQAWLESVGFQRRSRHHVHLALGLAVEIPGTVLDQGRDAYDRIVRWTVGDAAAAVLSLEDTVVDRLAAWVHGGAADERTNVLRLLSAWRDRVDGDVLGSLATDERVADALAEIQNEVDALEGTR